MEKEGDIWKMREVAADLDLQSKRDKTLPMIINGVAVESNKIALFPGAYTFTSGNKLVDYGKSNTLVVKSASEYPTGSVGHRADPDLGRGEGLHQRGQGQREEVHEVQGPQEPGCPNNVTKVSSVTPKEGTFKWSYDKDGWTT